MNTPCLDSKGIEQSDPLSWKTRLYISQKYYVDVLLQFSLLGQGSAFRGAIA